MVVGVLVYATRRLKVDGLAILLYFWLYSVGRCFISFYRVSDPLMWGLREAQVIALAVIVLAPCLAYWLMWRERRLRARRPPPAA